MKNKASGLFKEMLYVLSSVVKARSIGVRSKISAMKNRLIMLSLLRNKKVLVASISHKIHALLGHEDKREEVDVSGQSKAIVLYNAAADDSNHCHANFHENAVDDGDDDGDKYPDLTHSLFDEEDDQYFAGASGSVIDLVRNSKEDGEEFILEDEIDHVADLFIKQFHRQMRIQKQESFKRLQEMLARGL